MLEIRLMAMKNGTDQGQKTDICTSAVDRLTGKIEFLIIKALFKTLKYHSEYPSAPFQDIEGSEAWVKKFVQWYNFEHRHSGILFVTPASRHHLEDKLILKNRKEVYEEAKKRNPIRWASGKTRKWEPISEVTLNATNHKETTSSSKEKSA